MQNLPLLGLVAILVIGALEGYALSLGMDGVALAAICSLIAGLAGYIVPSPLQKKSPE